MYLIESGDPPLEPGILRRGLYADQVARYLESFDARKVLVLGFPELVEHPEQTIDTVIAFAHEGSEPRDTAGREIRPCNTGTYPSQCPEQVAQRLQAFYQPHNERRRHLLGWELRS